MAFGSRHQVTVEGTVEVPFRCTHCGFKAVALVHTKAEGERAAPFFLGMASALEKATLDAQKGLVPAAESLAEGATCPSCKRFDASSRRLTCTLNLIAPIGLILLGTALDLCVKDPWFLTTVVAGGWAAWLFFSTRWRWTEFDQRVQFRSP